MQILTGIALQFLYAVTKAWQGFRVALRTLKIAAFLCKLTAGLTKGSPGSLCVTRGITRVNYREHMRRSLGLKIC